MADLPQMVLADDDLPPRNDRELLTLCLKGDPDAWQALTARYQRLIYSIPIKMGLSPNDAADIFQSVCLKLLKNLSTLHNQDRISAWLTVTTRRESWRIAAMRQREQVFVPLDRPEVPGEFIEAPSTEPPLDELHQALEQQHILREAVAALPERCRQLITLLFYSNDLDYEEIARRMDMPRSSMGPTRARCLEKLRKLLDGRL
jgi:RNA polymerase sigma factor (sigma-70 family)